MRLLVFLLVRLFLIVVVVLLLAHLLSVSAVTYLGSIKLFLFLYSLD